VRSGIGGVVQLVSGCAAEGRFLTSVNLMSEPSWMQANQ